MKMLCDYCGEVIKEGETMYVFDDVTVCEDCLEAYLDDYVNDHKEVCRETVDDDPRYEPEFWEDR